MLTRKSMLKRSLSLPGPWCRRFLSSSTTNTQGRLRALLRDTAQPVAVVTSRLKGTQDHFHGATLSSFSSISMDPHPLVAFSLRLPSRMATALKSVNSQDPAHMVINVLSAAQMSMAVAFSRVDLHPEPFKDAPHTLTEEGLPILEGTLGALSCKMISSWPLHDLEVLTGTRIEAGSEWSGDGVASELFVARVIRVESILDPASDESLQTLPLLYHRRSYATTTDLPSSPSPNSKSS